MTLPSDQLISINQETIGGKRIASTVVPFSDATESLNEAIFFLKPEITSVPGINLAAVLELVNNQFQRFSVTTAGILVLSSRYLEENHIIDQHYGVINAISREGSASLADDVRSNLETTFAEDLRAGAAVVGGHQFLARYPFFSPAALSVLWDALNSSSRKLAPGTYALPINVWSERNVVLNGFHPHQLDHFHSPNRSIIVAAIRTKTSWSDLRDRMIGDTDPSKAEAGSIRREFFEKQSHFGIPVINKGLNGVHLSAGPLEGMIEVIRFCSDYLSKNFLTPSNTAFGKMLAATGMSENQIKTAMQNPSVDSSGKTISAFDLTEKMNASEAASVLRKKIS